jgi:hypothetical protein
MLSPEEAYKYDTTFQHIVDIMRAELRNYQITPAELRQAAILAATMHNNENIKPLTFPKFYKYELPMNMDPPAMFGGYEAVSGRTQSTLPNLANTPQLRRSDSGDRRDHARDTFDNNTRGKWDRHQGDYFELGRDKNGDRRKAIATEHLHIFRPSGNGYNVCDCGMSDVYYNWHTTTKS